jgi:hypothetical protein
MALDIRPTALTLTRLALRPQVAVRGVRRGFAPFSAGEPLPFATCYQVRAAG